MGGTVRRRQDHLTEKIWGLDDIPFYKTTVEGYNKKIKQSEYDIKACEKRIDEIKERFSLELEKIGLYLTKEQLDVWLSSVVGLSRRCRSNGIKAA